jgi:hypothetical protein
MTRSRKKQGSLFSIHSNARVFRIDKSKIPANKLDDLHLAEMEAALLKRLQKVTFRRGVCLHEAAHAIYMKRAGAFRVSLRHPVVLYDPQNEEFEFGAAEVRAYFGEGVPMNILAMARWYAAGGVAWRLLIAGDKWGEEGGDQSDFRVFSTHALKCGLSSVQISKRWEQAKRDVERDLRNPAFRRQLWARARKFEQRLLELVPEANTANSKVVT